MTTRPDTRDPVGRAAGPMPLTLDEQIALAEFAVIQRDERIRRRMDSIVHRTKVGAMRHAGVGALLGLGGAVFAWWLGRRKPDVPAPEPAAPPPAASGFEHLLREAGLSLAAVLPLIWPYMPRAIRKNVSPGTAGTIVGVLGPILAKLFRRAPAKPQQG